MTQKTVASLRWRRGAYTNSIRVRQTDPSPALNYFACNRLAGRRTRRRLYVPGQRSVAIQLIRRSEAARPAAAIFLFFLNWARAGASIWHLGGLPLDNSREQTLRNLCPVLCPPPNPTECDGVSLARWIALLENESVAIHHNWSHSVQVVGSSRGNSF